MIVSSSSENELAGTWYVKWSSKSRSSYTITKDNGVFTMRVLACSWWSCLNSLEAIVEESLNDDYKSEEGWVQIRNIHESENYVLYLKKDGDGSLAVVSYKPYSEEKYTGTGTRSKSLSTTSLSHCLKQVKRMVRQFQLHRLGVAFINVDHFAFYRMLNGCRKIFNRMYRTPQKRFDGCHSMVVTSAVR